MIRSLGQFALGAVNLAASVALTQALRALSGQQAGLAALKTQLTALLTPPTLPTPVQLAAQFAQNMVVYNPAQLLALLASRIPSVKLEVAAQLAQVEATQSVVAGLQTSLSAGGLRLYSFDGQAGALASELAGAVTGDVAPTAPIKALVVVTESPAAWAALSSTFKTS